MVTCTLAGYLGNQMFRIAATIGYAAKHGIGWHIPSQSSNPAVFPCYFPHISYPVMTTGFLEYQEQSFNYGEIPYYPNIRLDGLFQTEKYFSHCKSAINNLFFNPIDTIKDTVALCVRRGDYLNFPERHPVVTADYLHRCIKEMRIHGYSRFMIITNDPHWCDKEIVKMYDACEFVYPHIDTPLEKMQIASACEHAIISNSTYDWWIAWLMQNPSKIVLAPKKWFGPAYLKSGLPYRFDGQETYFDTSDLLPSNWIKI